MSSASECHMVIGGFIKNSKSKNKQPEESLRIATKHPKGCRCKIKKMIGSTNRIPKIEKLFKNSNDIELIVNFDDAIRANNLRKNNFLR